MAGATWGQGHVIAGRYRLGSLLGEGGMGSVWRAEHVTLKSPVAIKLLDPAISCSEEMLERFMREAQAAAALRSMHVVQIFDYGVEDGVPYIAMELMHGESLRDRLDRAGRLDSAQTARFMLHVGRAVAKAHEAGIVHRDLKPDNIFLVREDEEIAKVLDFGIAKLTNDGTGDPGVATRTGQMLGTPYYMSPEQAHGNRSVDMRTDTWAIAVIAYECLTGARPFDADALGELVLKICTEDPPVPSTVAAVPPGFDEWFARGVDKDPASRFQSVREMTDALEEILGAARSSFASSANTPPPQEVAAGPGFATTTGGQASAVPSLPTTSRTPAVVVVAGIAAAVIGAGALLVFGGSERPAEREPPPGMAAAGAQSTDDTAATPEPPAPTEPRTVAPVDPPAPSAETEPDEPETATPPPEPKRAAATQPKPEGHASPKPARTAAAPKSLPAPKPERSAKPPQLEPQPQPPSGMELFSDRK